MHYLYAFGKLPVKNEYKKLTPEYYKQKRKNNMIFEELNFLARHKFNSITEVAEYKEKQESKLPELKGKRENLWRKYNKTTDIALKDAILKEINQLTEEIDKIQAHKKACNRIIVRYEEIKEECKKEIEDKRNSQELLNAYNRKKTRVI